jgi:hypothetical protein
MLEGRGLIKYTQSFIKKHQARIRYNQQAIREHEKARNLGLQRYDNSV